MAAPLNVAECATCICTAKKPPDEIPATNTLLGSILYLGSATIASGVTACVVRCTAAVGTGGLACVAPPPSQPVTSNPTVTESVAPKRASWYITGSLLVGHFRPLDTVLDFIGTSLLTVARGD